ncbi:hypothetical protein AACH06_14145 [Ideonella sp. DXS29W]|uniref:Uncharacterized protein n=1 Tax=Ideonella lacteola TaxID=2984193 RepID=A0ABU9BST6_9BURK
MAVAIAGPAAAASPSIVGDGLKISQDSTDTWSPWQARLAMSAAPLPMLGHFGSPLLSGGNAMLAGDRYLGWGQSSEGGGLRATGALLLGANALGLASPVGTSHGEMLWRGTGSSVSQGDAESNAPMPYLGVGYSAWWSRTGFGVSADLGLAAQKPGQAVRFGRVMSGTESLDDMLRAMQLAPMLQVNLSYAF